MNTMQPLTRRFPLPAPEFAFAGFTWPRYVATLESGPRARRIERRRNPSTGPYYHAPRPITRQHQQEGRGFYLDGHGGAPGLRWCWCDEVPADWVCDVDPKIDHEGWFTDEFGDEKFRGLVFKLPRNRGFLAGWSMGEGMASEVDATVYCVASDAAYAADSMAEAAAERQREFEEEERERIEAEEGADQ